MANLSGITGPNSLRNTDWQTALDPKQHLLELIDALRAKDIPAIHRWLRTFLPSEINLVVPDKPTALTCVIQEGCLTLVPRLLDMGANPNLPDGQGNLPLAEARRFEPQACAEMLIARGADLNQLDAHGKTPLMHALQHGYESFAEYLLSRGADPNIINGQGQTAYDVCLPGYERILIAHGADLNLSFKKAMEKAAASFWILGEEGPGVTSQQGYSHPLAGLALYKNKYPTSWLETVGDTLLTPLPTLLRHRPFVAIKNELTGRQCLYTPANTSKSRLRVVGEIAASVATLPIALAGLALKAINLGCSKEARELYLHGEPPLQPPFKNPKPVNLFHPEGIRQRAVNLREMALFATKKGCSLPFLRELIEHFSDYGIYTHDGGLDGDHVILPPYLSECACLNSGNFNRFKNRRRTEIEDQMVQDAIAAFHPAQSSIRYVGLGVGGLLQDFINIGKLMLVGYKDIDVALIDPSLKPRKLGDPPREHYNAKLLAQFQFLSKVAEQEGIRLWICTYPTVADYQQANPEAKVQIISAIDFEDFDSAFADLLSCHHLLAPEGKMYLSWGLEDLCFGANSCLRNTQRRQPDSLRSKLIDLWLTDLRRQVQRLASSCPKTVRYVQLGKEFNSEEWTRMLPELAETGCETIEFTLLQPQKRNYWGCPNMGPNLQFTPETLQSYMRLFLPPGVQLRVQMASTLDEFKEDVVKSGERFDFITWCGDVSSDEPATNAYIRWLREIADNATAYFGLNTERWNGFWRWNRAEGTHHLIPTQPVDASLIEQMMDGKMKVS
jgi:hypothetical protein